MPCPTCDKTMGSLVAGIFYCPACGTVSMHDTVYVPALVKRCREFRADAQAAEWWMPLLDNLWHQLGIAESIDPPRRIKP